MCFSSMRYVTSTDNPIANLHIGLWPADRQRLLISRVIFAMSNGMPVWWFLHWQCMPSLPCLCVSLVILNFHAVQGYQVKQVQAFEVDTV